MRERLIGIDAGGTMTKVAVFDADGAELACEHRPNTMLFPKAGWTERDPDAMWRSAAEAIRLVLERSGTAAGQVAAVTPCGFGGGLFFVDGEGAVVRPGLVSTDSRSRPTIAAWDHKGLRARLEPMIQQQIWPGQSLAILGWMNEHEPEALAATASLLLCKDFLRLRLCGDVSTDPTDGGCAGLLDVAKGSYALDALGLAGLEGCIGKLPAIGASCEVAGRISAEAARQTGLLAGTPVVRGVYDVVACSLASGVASPSHLGIVAGTFAINSTLHRVPCLDPMPTLQAAYPLGGLYLATTATPTSASNLEWLCKTLLAAEADRAKADGRSIYDVCSALVAGSLDRETDMLFFPYLFGGPSGAPGGLIGVVAGNDLADVLRTVFEGIVFAHRADLDMLLGGRGSASPSTIRLSGGPSRSDVFAQMFADGLAMPVEIANGTEFGAKGAAMCASVALGIHADLEAASKAMVRVERRFEPDAARTAVLDRHYDRYRAVGDGLVSAWSATRSPARRPASAGSVRA